MNYGPYFLAGIILGAFSWAVCPWVSGQFEPFDTLIGFAIGQASMLAFTVYIGWTKKLACLMLAIVGLYLGQNIYSYIFGSSETRAWMLLGLFSSMFLCILPFLGGLVARWISSYRQRGTESV